LLPTTLAAASSARRRRVRAPVRSFSYAASGSTKTRVPWTRLTKTIRPRQPGRTLRVATALGSGVTTASKLTLAQLIAVALTHLGLVVFLTPPAVRPSTPTTQTVIALGFRPIIASNRIRAQSHAVRLIHGDLAPGRPRPLLRLGVTVMSVDSANTSSMPPTHNVTAVCRNVRALTQLPLPLPLDVTVMSVDNANTSSTPPTHNVTAVCRRVRAIILQVAGPRDLRTICAVTKNMQLMALAIRARSSVRQRSMEEFGAL
jgi:hypothetical protein